MSLDLIASRIAEALRAYGEDTSSVAVCRQPGGGTNWCRGKLRGAAFTDAWDDFEW